MAINSNGDLGISVNINLSSKDAQAKLEAWLTRNKKHVLDFKINDKVTSNLSKISKTLTNAIPTQKIEIFKNGLYETEKIITRLNQKTGKWETSSTKTYDYAKQQKDAEKAVADEDKRQDRLTLKRVSAVNARNKAEQAASQKIESIRQKEAENEEKRQDKLKLKQISAVNARIKIHQREVDVLKNGQYQIENLTNKINVMGSDKDSVRILSKNKALSDEYKNAKTAVESLSTAQKNGTITAQQYKTKYAEVNQQVKTLSSNIEVAKNNTENFATKTLQNIKAFASWYLIGNMVASVARSIGKSVQTVKDLNASLVDLQMATGGTYDETNLLLNSYSQMGKELGATTIEVAQSADSFLRQGQSLADTNVLIKDSMVLSKVAQLDSATSTQFLTAAMKGNNKAPYVQQCA